MNLQILFNRPLPCLNPKVFFHPYFKEKKRTGTLPEKKLLPKIFLAVSFSLFFNEIRSKRKLGKMWVLC
ncbi:hypothetical protein B4098_1671 [Heyndrickxia coagulans]|uniref:Uncharacterized protein n=1 Tax=Heyndrickxia coagulans TaxID=1398 RepID=A0A150K756_HEYCO|nr:hypothetical protein B4098_1671 [Heyndrickxia coagulans]